jgi:hypothetical protein
MIFYKKIFWNSVMDDCVQAVSPRLLPDNSPDDSYLYEYMRLEKPPLKLLCTSGPTRTL